jgi:hypothetical protein
VKLTELAATFIRRELRPCHVGAPGCSTVSEHAEHEYHVPVASLEDADGVLFLCPKYFHANGGAVGSHSIICWRPRVPADVMPGPGRWEFFGAGVDDLTLLAGSSSIQLHAGCAAHFWIEKGEIARLT